MRTRVKALGPVNVAVGPHRPVSERRWLSLSPVRLDGRTIGACAGFGGRCYVAAFWHRARQRR